MVQSDSKLAVNIRFAKTSYSINDKIEFEIARENVGNEPLAAPALIRSLSGQVVHPVWCGLEIPTLDLAYKAYNFAIHIYRHSGCMA